MRLMLRVILWPLSSLYSLVVRFRNHLYNIGYKKSFSFETRVISVGNLSLGGNGKTPMVEYLVRLVCDEFSTAVLSRGYGRSSKGFKLATAGDTVDNLGDEPLQMYLKFHPRIEVAVGESRALAIPNILLDRPNTELVILDDAFQHRSVVPNLSILVTDYWNPFFNDQVIPAGRLREPKSGVSRADIIVVTKCPFNLKKEEQQNYFKLIRKYHQHVPIYFTTIAYQDPVHFIKGTSAVSGVNVLLLTGIAKPESMVDYVSKQFNLIDHIRYRDHFRYQKKHVDQLGQRFSELQQKCDIILTTEKDMVRLTKFKSELSTLPIYYLPIECSFIEDGKRFDFEILNRLRSVKNSRS